MNSSPARRAALLATGTAATLVTALGVLVAGVHLGADDPDTVGPSQGSDPFRLASAALAPTASCDALLDSYQERALELVGPWGWQGGGDQYFGERTPLAGDMDMGSVMSNESTTSARTSRAESSETGTNVQEAGVDEPDTVKTDGEHLFRLHGSQLTTYDVSGEAPTELATIRLPELRTGEILLHGHHLVAVGDGRDHDPTTTITTIDVSEAAAPRITETLSVSAASVTARLHGDVVRVVIRNGLPELDFKYPDDERGQVGARRHNEQVVSETTLADWLPHIDGDSAVECAAVAVPEDPDTALGTVTTLAFTPGGDERRAVAVATSTEIAYFSGDRLHLATQANWFGFRGGMGRTSDSASSPIRPSGELGRTQLYSFALDDLDTTFVAAGEVKGAIADRWSMDSADGVLRVAVGPTAATGNFNSVVTLGEEDGLLVERGRVDKLGIDEEIKSVRWFDDLALVVTFREVDPLYAIDLSEPAAPVLLGELKIPGFSEYLHPIGPHRMIGIGQDAADDGTTTGAQAALFNVSDLTNLRRADVVAYPAHTYAAAGQDPRQFTWLPEKRTALTVITDPWDGRTAWVSTLRVRSGKLQESRTRVTYGDNAALVRTVPLASGKVVLVTDDEVTFFDVD
ncbi:beta-propeller domain-containing protein [Nocardioides gilvus]|uniref:beta-propeller domain-containing protein n=1 Tax=Nocardioides gilvus TaxID=1735589 RepID=UPI000D744CE0|nr:beta-propeller domain-containing protein [Nocardioides gilvus]